MSNFYTQTVTTDGKFNVSAILALAHHKARIEFNAHLLLDAGLKAPESVRFYGGDYIAEQAAAICIVLDIPYEHQKLMTADQVLSLVQWDHWPIRRDDGLALGMSLEEVDRFSNLFPRPIMAHREKTAKIDIPQIAKSRRILEKETRRHRPFAESAGMRLKPKREWPKGQTIPSRPFNSKGKRKVR